MTEYIDRAKTQAYLYKNMMWYDEEGYIAEDSEKDKALWDLVKGVPAADVVEREKIDKAIEEIQKLRGCSCSCSDGVIDDVEDILDKLIESEE